ncbi:hypothetical protein EMIHUDRAFT_235158 [Emiliania huxleyi CCMP1516]|uniref:Uncharacterized protein n=2 Tax=Emiliania huxleyi TaxID=2903 RepID=A0A0D3JX54_EMIH1|nr:hypothetical protein EMIHUDRAFT_235158 [Emiliania huxleyi CCMP1516]EOD28089.1 hypothetical protein EMIHUDRAFT_235158 [Emiliania huxleyi CCMP1516]|eukprot:XP_005780518.1 hypothetical protein EMIHUDRAFT_235158 [Emiliania huxleyi CCMP1516]
MALPSWVLSARTAEISETEAQAAFSGMQTVELTLPTAVASGPVVTRYLKTAVEPSPEEEPPLLLVHGFDISLALEYRRLLPLLEALGIEGQASAFARLLEERARQPPGRWVGASLGACVALDCYRAEPGAFRSFASLAPAFFTPPPPVLPAPLGRLLLQNVLTAPSVRESIAKQAYHVKEDQTEDAIRCGNLHLSRAEWEEDSLEWLMSGAARTATSRRTWQSWARWRRSPCGVARTR